MRNNNLELTLSFALCIFLLSYVLPVGATSEDRARPSIVPEPISFPVSCGNNISTSFAMMNDLNACPNDGLRIVANNVHIDCKGHKISGTGTGSGIVAVGKQNVVVKNCVIKSFRTGINFFTTNSSRIDNSTLSGNSFSGIYVRDSDSNLFKSVIVTGQTEGIGIYLRNSSNNSIRNVIASENGIAMWLYRNSNLNIIEDTISSSNYNGIRVDDGSALNIIQNVRSFDNYKFDFGFFTSNNNKLLNIYAFGHGENTVYLFRSDSNNISNVTFLGNDYAVNAINSRFNSISSSIIRKNTFGLVFDGSSNNNLIFNNIIDNIINVVDESNANHWNTTKSFGTNIFGGSYTGGNYWGNYLGVDIDNDGFGDSFLPFDSNGSISYGGDYLPIAKLCGDLNDDGILDNSDLELLIGIAFRGESLPNPSLIADINGDGVISDIVDVEMLTNYVLRGGPRPTCSVVPV